MKRADVSQRTVSSSRLFSLFFFIFRCEASFAFTFVFLSDRGGGAPAESSDSLSLPNWTTPALPDNSEHTHLYVGGSNGYVAVSLMFCYTVLSLTHTQTHKQIGIHPCGGGLFEEGTEPVLLDCLVRRV